MSSNQTRCFRGMARRGSAPLAALRGLTQGGGIMSELADILDELRRIHDGDAWHGAALKESLSGVTAEQAAARPVAGAHSIWELVRHVTAWENVFRLRLEGRPVAEPEEGDIPTVGDVSEES